MKAHQNENAFVDSPESGKEIYLKKKTGDGGKVGEGECERSLTTFVHHLSSMVIRGTFIKYKNTYECAVARSKWQKATNRASAHSTLLADRDSKWKIGIIRACNINVIMLCRSLVDVCRIWVSGTNYQLNVCSFHREPSVCVCAIEAQPTQNLLETKCH